MLDIKVKLANKTLNLDYIYSQSKMTIDMIASRNTNAQTEN